MNVLDLPYCLYVSDATMVLMVIEITALLDGLGGGY